MKITNYEVKDTTVNANIDFTEEEIASHFQSLYKEYAPSIAIPGFRKGKAPLHLLKSHIIVSQSKPSVSCLKKKRTIMSITQK